MAPPTSKKTSSGRGRSKTPPPPKKTESNTISSLAMAPKSVLLGGVNIVTGALEGAYATGSGMLDFSHNKNSDNDAFESAVKRCIPSNFILISSQDDVTQAMEDYYAAEHYALPRIPGISRSSRNGNDWNAGSAATCALLQLWHEEPQRLIGSGKDSGSGKPLTCFEVLKETQRRVKQASALNTKPQITSSRPLGPPRLATNESAPFYIVPPECTGTRRALLIGVIAGEAEDLKGPHNDVRHMQHFLIHKCGFHSKDVITLMDNGRSDCPQPTKAKILEGFATLVKQSKPKDVVFVQFSGHGGAQRNPLAAGYDSYILPCDYKKKGQIMDDVILRDLIKALPHGVHGTMVVDCCYSGTVGDLPYILKSTANGGRQIIEPYFDTETQNELLEMEEKAGTKEYDEWKHRKAEQKSLTANANKILEAILKLATDAANATMDAASKGAHATMDAASKGAHAASDMTVSAATTSVDMAKRGATSAATVTSIAATNAATATSQSLGYMATSATGVATQATTATTAGLGSVARSTSDATNKAAASTAEAFTSAADVAAKFSNTAISSGLNFMKKK